MTRLPGYFIPEAEAEHLADIRHNKTVTTADNEKMPSALVGYLENQHNTQPA